MRRAAPRILGLLSMGFFDVHAGVDAGDAADARVVESSGDGSLPAPDDAWFEDTLGWRGDLVEAMSAADESQSTTSSSVAKASQGNGGPSRTPTHDAPSSRITHPPVSASIS